MPASPEQLVRVVGDRVTTMPIAGMAAGGRTAAAQRRGTVRST